MKIDFGAVWSGEGLRTDRELRMSSGEAFNCMDTCHHLDEGQFLTTIDP